MICDCGARGSPKANRTYFKLAAMPEPKETNAAPMKAPPEEENPPAASSEEAQQSKVPPGIVPLFLSTQTQQIFECVCDEHVTKQNPHKLIPKEKFAEDIQNRAAVSDFQPLKKKIKVRSYLSALFILIYIYTYVFIVLFTASTTMYLYLLFPLRHMLAMNCFLYTIMTLCMSKTSTCVSLRRPRN